MTLPTIPSTHRWIDGGAVVRYVGNSVIGPGKDAVVFCWDRDTDAAVTDLYDQFGNHVDRLPVVDNTFLAAVPKTVAKPVFSVGVQGSRFAGNDWESVANAKAAADSAASSATSAANSAALVGAPAGSAMDAYMGGSASGLVPVVAGKVAKGDLVINVKDAPYNAKGDGATNDTAAVQAAINAATAGAIIFFPPGVYSMTAITGTGKSGVTLRGVRGKSILQLRSGTGPLLGWNVTATPGTNDSKLTFDGITFKGVTGFAQFTHLLSLSAVDDVLVTNCDFIQFPGDGLYLGRTQVGGSDTGIQNRRVKVTNCLFDGVDYTNRNGISIIAGDDILIQGCTFTRCSTSTMPGAIDIEPNSADTSTILRDIRIVDNTFKAVGGNTGAVGMAFPVASPTTQPVRLLIKGNTFSGSKASDVYVAWVGHAATDTDAVTSIAILDNMFGAADAAATARAVTVDGLRGVRVEGNTFNGGRINGAVALGGSQAVREVSVDGNTIIDQGGTVQQIINVWNAAKVTVSDNIALFTTATASHLVYCNTGATSNTLYVLRNVTRGVNYCATVDPGHTTTASTNRAEGNIGAPIGTPASFAGAPAVTGSRGGNAALASLLTQLAARGVIVDSSTA